jgi:hypothetical protein
MNKKYIQRFSELQQQLEHIESTRHKEHLEHLNNREVEMVDWEAFSEWKVKAKTLLINSCGADSEHYKEFRKADELGVLGSSFEVLLHMRAFFRAAKEDYEGGYLTSARSLVQAEVFDSVLEQSSELLSSGYHVAAAVIAGVALETGLRELCNRHSVAHGKLNKMNDDLVKASVYNLLQQKRITALADIRNNAAHGIVGKFTEEDVRLMIRDVDQFLGQHMVD